MSLIILFIRGFQRILENHDDDHGMRTMKSEMLSSLNSRYGNAESNETLVLTTLIDPRFKDKFFSGTREKNDAKELLDEKVAEITSTEEPRVPDILEEAGVEVGTHNPVVDKYLAEPLTPFHRGNSFSWCAENKTCFLPLAKISQRYCLHLQLLFHQRGSFLVLVKSTIQRGTVLPLIELRCCYSSKQPKTFWW